MSVAVALHVLAAAVWVGGMFFAYLALRPALGAVDPPLRCTLWRDVLARFFRFVWASVAVLLATGYWMALVPLGGLASVGAHVHLMQGIGLLMMGLFAYVWLAPFAALRRAVAQADWPVAGAALGRIRTLVAVNLVLGLAVIAIAAGGRWL